jgi:hypothetical protein
MKSIKHVAGGNCWEGITAPQDEDACMEHEEPRGECAVCPRCPACDADFQREPLIVNAPSLTELMFRGAFLNAEPIDVGPDVIWLAGCVRRAWSYGLTAEMIACDIDYAWEKARAQR